MGVDHKQLLRSEFSTDSESEAEDFAQRVFSDNRTRFLSSPNASQFAASTATGAGVSAVRIRSTIDFAMAFEPFDEFVFVGVDGGQRHMRWGSEEAVTTAGGYCLCPLGVALRLEVRNADVSTLRLPVERMKTAAREIAGPCAMLDFHGFKPVSTAIARGWSAVMDQATGEMLAEDSMLTSPLVYEQMLRMVALAALHTFPNSLMRHDRIEARPRMSSASLRRAMTYIDDNAHLPLALTDIADAVGASPRALQYAFSRQLDTTPMRYLRRVRLQSAHRDLHDADPSTGTTVQEVARRWGFAAPGRFAAEYRVVYGHSPSQTLRS